MVQSTVARAARRLGRTMAQYRPWNRSDSLGDGPDWMPDPLTPPDPPLVPHYRRRAGIPVAALALLCLLAAPVLALDSALKPSSSLFSATGTTSAVMKEGASSSTPSPSSATVPKGQVAVIVNPSGPPGSTPTGNSDPTPAPSASDTATPSPTATPDPSPSDPSTPTPSPSETASPSGSGDS